MLANYNELLFIFGKGALIKVKFLHVIKRKSYYILRSSTHLHIYIDTLICVIQHIRMVNYSCIFTCLQYFLEAILGEIYLSKQLISNASSIEFGQIVQKLTIKKFLFYSLFRLYIWLFKKDNAQDTQYCFWKIFKVI